MVPGMLAAPPSCRVVSGPAPHSVCPASLLPAGVARSISSDVDNLMRLISVANILPRGLYVENAVKVGGPAWDGGVGTVA